MNTYDVVVVGAGPAGLGAAIESAKAGAHTLLLDENERPGGQLFKQIHKFFGSQEHHAGTRGFEIGNQLMREAEDAQVEIRLSTRVWGIFDDGSFTACTAEKSYRGNGRCYILATGATENALAFPGNTLPGVMTAGAAQTMINLRHVRPGRRAVVVGSGNVGLIVSYQLMQAGVDIACIVEAAPALSGYAVHAGKVRRAGVPVLLSHTVVEAQGVQELERVVIAKVDDVFQPIPGSTETVEADLLCLAVGLTPRVELAALCGCEMTFQSPLGGLLPLHSERMETTRPNVLIAGDITGIEEASTALDEGRLAGTQAAASLGYLTSSEAQARQAQIFSRISALRQGPFGDKRQLCKQAVWTHYKHLASGSRNNTSYGWSTT